MFVVSLLWVIVVGNVGLVTSLPIFFEKCNYKGWSCENYPDDTSVIHRLTFTCNEETGWNVTVDLENLEIPPGTVSVIVQWCNTVNLTLSQSEKDRSRVIESITMLGINVLLLENSNKRQFSNPPIIIFKDIDLIPVIPTNTFTSFSNIKADHIMIKNVTIGEIEHQAFDVLEATLIIDQTFVKLIDTKAIRVHNNNKVQITNSKFISLESKAFEFSSPQVEIYKCHFSEELREQSIVVKGDLFFFYLNSVNFTHSNAFNITAQNITFVSNDFQTISSGAFDEVHPHYSGQLKKYTKPPMLLYKIYTLNKILSKKEENRVEYTPFNPDPFFYQFRENIIHWAEPYALHHSWELYDNDIDSTNILLVDNHFNCSCFLFDMEDKLEIKSKFDFFDSLLAKDTNECINAYTYSISPTRNLSLSKGSSLKKLKSLCKGENEISSSNSLTISRLVLFTSIIISRQCCLFD